MKIHAILPAAGLSKRMGQPKLALPLGDRTILERVLDVLRIAEVDSILVVLGPQSAFLGDSAEALGADVLRLTEETPDMRATLQAGLRWLADKWRWTAEDALLILPADHPVLEPGVIRALKNAFVENPRTAAAVPIHQGSRGHPLLLSARYIPNILALSESEGLNALIRRLGKDVLELDWPSDAVLRDLDTPADYENLKRAFYKGP